MNEIYWLLILDDIEKIFAIATVLSCIAIGVLLVVLLSYNGDNKEDEEEVQTHVWKWIKRLIVVVVLSVLCNIFIPNTKQAMIIWGVGGTIDYIKSNDTAKQLPDKCIKALDKFVDEYMLNEENNKEK